MIKREEIIGDCRLILGDCLEVMPELGKVDAVITDPPYSSGGQFRGDRSQKTSSKYVQTGSAETCHEEFSGDNRDQRAFLAWSTMWLGRAMQISNQGAICCIFTDWRQLPTTTDAIQCGGWVWRNLATWWKPGIRMQKGRFSSSAEYIVYGSNGMPITGEKSPQNVLSFPPVSGKDKEHIAEKPLGLMEILCGLTLPKSTVIDPFMGSGTTGIACINTDRKFIGIELGERAFDIACKRIDQAQRQGKLFQPPKPKPEARKLFP